MWKQFNDDGSNILLDIYTDRWYIYIYIIYLPNSHLYVVVCLFSKNSNSINKNSSNTKDKRDEPNIENEIEEI